jgi:hypothetical protein
LSLFCDDGWVELAIPNGDEVSVYLALASTHTRVAQR